MDVDDVDEENVVCSVVGFSEVITVIDVVAVEIVVMLLLEGAVPLTIVVIIKVPEVALVAVDTVVCSVVGISTVV
jgi:hypothetical protein